MFTMQIYALYLIVLHYILFILYAIKHVLLQCIVFVHFTICIKYISMKLFYYR